MARQGGRVFGVGDLPEVAAVVDQPVLLETLERRADASLLHVDGVDDLSLAKRLVGVLEQELVDLALCRVGGEVGHRPVLVGHLELVF
ncbi:hypothetical protein [Natrinema salaciae]|uniref:hypothetical protein n=1 Tax=Natrinema salaciae TaxID=1186196 RepID=UPI001587E401|nr:hypothetical protein [Natrinema salaciae]